MVNPTIVLHGFPDHPPTAKPFLAELVRRGRHVVAPWLRGYAPSPTAGPFDFAALTGDVLALIDRWVSGATSGVDWHDWGALITYDACVTAPERIERAVALAIPHPLTFMSRLTNLAQLRRELVHGPLSMPGSGWIATRPAISPSSTASGVSGRLASRSIPLSGGATRASAQEHARAPKVLPSDAATRHDWCDVPHVSADHGAPVAASRC